MWRPCRMSQLYWATKWVCLSESVCICVCLHVCLDYSGSSLRVKFWLKSMILDLESDCNDKNEDLKDSCATWHPWNVAYSFTWWNLGAINHKLEPGKPCITAHLEYLTIRCIIRTLPRLRCCIALISNIHRLERLVFWPALSLWRLPDQIH